MTATNCPTSPTGYHSDKLPHTQQPGIHKDEHGTYVQLQSTCKHCGYSMSCGKRYVSGPLSGLGRRLTF